MEKYFEINEDGHNIRCKLYYDKIPDIKKVVVFGHGFAGHKDNSAAGKFADRVLTKYKGIAVLTFNFPCHGDDVKKKLILEDCSTYLTLVIQYIKDQFQTDEIYAYGTSFGGYLFLKYIKEHGNPFKRIVLRCPAINIYDALMHSIMKSDDLEKLKKGKSVQIGFDRKVAVTEQFMEELHAADIREWDFIDYAEDILIIHGNKDEVVSHETSAKFADDNIIEFVEIDGADHRFMNPKHMEAAIKAIIDFYGWS